MSGTCRTKWTEPLQAHELIGGAARPRRQQHVADLLPVLRDMSPAKTVKHMETKSTADNEDAADMARGPSHQDAASML